MSVSSTQSFSKGARQQPPSIPTVGIESRRKPADGRSESQQIRIFKRFSPQNDVSGGERGRRHPTGLAHAPPRQLRIFSPATKPPVLLLLGSRRPLFPPTGRGAEWVPTRRVPHGYHRHVPAATVIGHGSNEISWVFPPTLGFTVRNLRRASIWHRQILDLITHARRRSC